MPKRNRNFNNMVLLGVFNLKSCADPESFVRGGPTLTTSIFVDEGREDPSTTISGLSSARQQNAIKWRFAGVPIMVQH